MYSGEDLVLDVRLNQNFRYVDYFVIIESKFKHDGSKKEKKFDLNKFNQFKDKIKYYFIEDLPLNLRIINSSDATEIQKNKKIDNALIRENYQRDMISIGLENCEDEDFILVGDIDEIPNLKDLNFNKLKDNIIIFQQLMFYYKFNLNYKDFTWYGTKGCIKKKLKSPQWLRNIKNKKYNFFRFDTLFSNTKYTNVKFIENGGWHFSNIMNSKDLFDKLSSFLHHVDFQESSLTKKDIENKIKKNLVFYDHQANSDQKNKWEFEKKLHKFKVSELPNHISNNLEKFSNWIEK